MRQQTWPPGLAEQTRPARRVMWRRAQQRWGGSGDAGAGGGAVVSRPELVEEGLLDLLAGGLAEGGAIEARCRPLRRLCQTVLPWELERRRR